MKYIKCLYVFVVVIFANLSTLAFECDKTPSVCVCLSVSMCRGVSNRPSRAHTRKWALLVSSARVTVCWHAQFSTNNQWCPSWWLITLLITCPQGETHTHTRSRALRWARAHSLSCSTCQSCTACIREVLTAVFASASRRQRCARPCAHNLTWHVSEQGLQSFPTH